MTRSYLNHRFLMDESEQRIEEASRSVHENERFVAQRILESEKRHRSWESSHYQLMKTIAEPYSTEAQFQKLKQTAISLTHRQALFGYLRDNAVTGTRRHALFEAFYGTRDFVNAVLAEHGNFLSAASSAMCASHLSQKIWHEVTFASALADYEDAYRAYFSVFCDSILASAEQRELYTGSLLQYLKKEAVNKRSDLLSAQARPLGVYRAVQRRRPARRGHDLNPQSRIRTGLSNS